MKNFKLLDCYRPDCKLYISDAKVSYHAPLYDNEGKNLAIDLSITTGKLSCESCGRAWNFTDSYSDIVYQEIEK